MKQVPPSANSGPPTSGSVNTPLNDGGKEGGADLGDLTSSVSFGPKSKRQYDTVVESDLGQDGKAWLSGLESDFSTGQGNEVESSVTLEN